MSVETRIVEPLSVQPLIVLPLGGQPRFLVVRVLMLLHVILSDKSLTARITFERPFTGVDAGMPLEVGFVGEYFRAGVALVLPRKVVHLHVFLVLFLILKSLAALRAFEWLFARVGAFVMLREIATFPERLVAFDAYVFPRNRIGFGGGNLALLARVSLALALLLRLQANVRV